jgi:energy-coupling factor transporter ATP-binding protein EcfA2
MANAIEARGLRKRFGKATALDGLDLTVAVGEVHAFLGPNGAGKTTTIRILLGLLRKDGGDVSLLGGDPWRDATALHGRLAYVPGDVTLWPAMTGGEIIDLLARLRGGETAGRADPVLAGSVGRARWALSHLMVAFAGTAALLVVAGVATGLGYGLAAGGAGGETARMLGAGLAQLPAAAVIVGVAALACCARPDACVAVAWTAVGLAVLLNIFGQALQLSRWVLDMSPFTHGPKLPGGTVAAVPLFWLSVITLVLCAAGLAAVRRRDIG